MNRSRAEHQVVIGALVLTLLSACSKPEPHLGSTVTAAANDTTTVVIQDSRSILPSGGLAGEESTLVEVEARVQTIDLRTRALTVNVPEGKTQTLTIPPEVNNFSQIRPGDLLKVSYRQRVAFEVREPTAEEMALSGKELDAASSAPLGALPRGTVTAAKLSVVTIDSISTEKQQVNVKTQDGRVVPISAKYPENLALLKKGQRAVVTYGESVVAGVERIQ